LCVRFIEPGYYEEGRFGIRIENVCIVVSADIDNQFGRFLTFEPITLVPIQKKFLDPSLLTADEVE
jgi:Xaa-Pro aminopeptidase